MLEMQVFEVPDGGKQLLSVICDEETAPPFPDASCIMQEALQLQGGWKSEEIRWIYGQLDEKDRWSPELLRALASIDQETGGPWRLFVRACVVRGPLTGVEALGLGSNQKKMQRSAGVALALAAIRARRVSPPSPGGSELLQPLFDFVNGIGIRAVGIDRVEDLPLPRFASAGMEGCGSSNSSGSSGSSGSVGGHRSLSNSPVATPLPAPAVPATDEACEAMLICSNKEVCPADEAKLRLVDFRRRAGPFSRAQEQFIKELLRAPSSGVLRDPSVCFGGQGAAFVADLCAVLEHDTWNGKPCGESWLHDYLHWRSPFCDLEADVNFSFGKTEAKRRAHWRWYFGSAPFLASLSSFAAAAVASGEAACAARAAPADAQGKALAVSARCQPRDPELPPSATLPGSSLKARSSAALWLDGVPSLPENEPAPAVGMPLPLPEERDLVAERLRQSRSIDCLSIRTVGSADTIPLGTDLDPENGYCNLWAASKLADPNAKRLVQYDLGRRVIDAENVGYSYGREVQGCKDYSFEGVRRAILYFRNRGLAVVVVSKRDLEELRCLGEGVEVVAAERTDDVMVLKTARGLNCPFVSRDGYRNWMDDKRLSRELRTWLLDAAKIQVRFSWGPGGEFIPDFDLETPVLRPSASEGGSWTCKGCGENAAEGQWAWWRQEWGWFCQGCWDKWAVRRS
mmetsp:Transcript_110408/g.285436  ORF Transcript_110408/g.285436 Transcript_110408/m.285436 type:complete len:685 (+) Transcript_110408:93-2147(+)